MLIINKLFKRKLSEKYIRKHLNKLDWFDISEKGQLSQTFIRQFKDQVDWVLISINHNLSKDFIFQFEEKVDIIKSLNHHQYDEKFLEDILSSCEGIQKQQIIWYMCQSQNLSEKFMRKYSQLINWVWVSKYQNDNMSDHFLLDFKDKIEWTYFIQQQKSDRIPQEVKDKISNKVSEFYEKYKVKRDELC